MRVGQRCTRGVVTIDVSADVAEAARLMRLHHVGYLVVLDQRDSHRRPAGVLTDRDIVVQIDARQADPRELRVEEVMTRDPVLATEHDDVLDVVQAMRLAGIRRAPVVDSSGALTGVITIDDLIGVVTEVMCDITGSIRNEQRIERRVRPG